MIIRKPYAFLIKNFRLINFIILLFSSYILYKTSGAFNFFNDYATTRGFIESATLINDTIPLTMVGFSIVLIVGCISIAILFKKKDKPVLFYTIGTIYYTLFIIACIISRSIIKIIMFEGIDPRIARLVRDAWLIFMVVQVIFVIYSLVRTVGFDIKKFNFFEDLNELQITDEDNEEIEISTKFDTDKVKMRAAMQKEELKSFFYENKFIIISILLLLFIVIPSAFIAKNIIDNKKYVIGEVINLNKFNLKITGAYTTKKDYRGKTIFKEDNSYLIVSFNINNLTDIERGINLNNLRLEVNNKIYIPKTNYYEYFIDIGKGYNNDKIKKETKDFIAVYVINDEDLNSEMIIRYADKLTVKNQMVNADYYRTIIKHENLDYQRSNVDVSLGKEIMINNRLSDNIRLKLLDYDLQDKFEYDVDGKTKYIINNSGLVLSLDYEFLNNNIKFEDFINKYVTINYKYNNCTYTQKINIMTYNKNKIYFAVTESMKDASEINFIVNIRNTEYVYKLK